MPYGSVQIGGEALWGLSPADEIYLICQQIISTDT